jgi:hypothetical protein
VQKIQNDIAETLTSIDAIKQEQQQMKAQLVSAAVHH